MCARVCVCVCVCERERERERVYVRVCVRERERGFYRLSYKRKLQAVRYVEMMKL